MSDRNTHDKWQLVVLAVVLLAVATLVSACGGGPATAAADRIEPSALGDVPIPADATPSGPPVADGATTTRSFEVTGMTPEQAVDFYVTGGPAQGWSVETEPHPTGSTDWQVVLAKGSRTLTASSAPWNGNGGAGDVVSELTVMVQQ